MLKLLNESLDAIKGDCHLSTATRLNDNVWLAHPREGDHLIQFKYSYGILSISMAERYYDLESNYQMIAMDNEAAFTMSGGITFGRILSLLNWRCDDYFD